MSAPDTRSEPWGRLSALTPARIGLGRAGSGLGTHETLRFALAHAQARDAVHAALDEDRLAAELGTLGLDSLRVASRAAGRASYLLRPDLGRSLDAASRTAVEARVKAGCDIALVIADGLSASAVTAQTEAFLASFLPLSKQHGWSLSPAVIVSQGRVAIGDEIGALLGARLTLLLIGERPGLSSPDSLGLYITHAPRPGRNDGERNCVSNIHGAGLSPAEAAARAAWLIEASLSRGLSGVALKDESASSTSPRLAAP
ncbi:ethanolamine ammonia-lyase subunit EutC [Bosea sp. BH3]|uniref:ethanolamine ammonia-lyase subunit EutC n=1 Tax=Bosea sp. BH3 TaxID=2871701 RepID=UPI0021CB46E3|nr:ethanolamine ammonia-lyase subunit EutC [Bosea sp. BH3]MCU4181364.1 ethanolamine ammonia-lyase subunit EutC [Bosea sp. BH3]